jgi:hypothetical protein
MNHSEKRNLIAATVAATLAASAAHALPPAAFTDGTITAANTFYAAGGSAQELAAYWAITQNLVASSIDVYSDVSVASASGSFAAGSYLIVTGTTNGFVPNSAFTPGSPVTAPPVPTGTNIAYFYKFNGGSFPNGVQPQIGSGVALPYPTAALLGASVSTGATGASVSTPTYRLAQALGTNTITQTPDWGLADVEAKVFNAPYNLNNVAPLTSTQLGTIVQDAIYDDVFGVAVSNVLCNGTAGTAATGALTTFAGHAKCNFSKFEVAAILSGAYTDWNQLYADDGTQLPSQGIMLLDRGSGSGSKAAGSLYFLNYPSTIAEGGVLQPNLTNAATLKNTGLAAPTVLNTSVTTYQDVKEGSNSAIVTDLQNANAKGLAAIAILSAEFAPALNEAPAGVNQYSFAKIDGVGIDTGTVGDNINSVHGAASAGTKYTNVILGKYDFFYQNAFNTRTAFLAGTSAAAKFANAIKWTLNSPNIAGAKSATGVTGVLVDGNLYSTFDKGMTLYTRGANSYSPLIPSFDATVGALTLGTDAL